MRSLRTARRTAAIPLLLGALVAPLTVSLSSPSVGPAPALVSAVYAKHHGGGPAHKATKKHQVRKAPPFSPRSGVLFNNPVRPKRQQVIQTRILKTLGSMRSGDIARISDWNIQSRPFAHAAIAAHRRGVRVQILMSRAVAQRQTPGYSSFRQLRRGLSHGPGPKGSWIRGCVSSCRGGKGIMHAKVVLANRSGSSRWVVMVSSANMTTTAGYSQWNDLFTLTGNRALFHRFATIFDAEARDKPVRKPYRTYSSKGVQAYFNPHARGDVDPVMWDLTHTGCGRTGKAGINGHTAVRIAQTALVGWRGIAIAKRLAQMQRNGCNIKMVYTLMGSQIRLILKQGHVRMRQLTRDTNGDGYYDLYLHTKVLAISGRYVGKPNQYLVRNGSENWTPVAFYSDEAGFRLHLKWAERIYGRWINYAFSIASTYIRPKLVSTTRGNTRFAPPATNPYRYVELN